jgi:glycogen debranching enzyme
VWADDCAAFETDNPTLNELLEQSREDMRMLLDRYPTGIYPTGGMPWFAVPFGRDALIASSFVLPMNPEVARGALRFLAAHQGLRVDPRTEEEPGKILHEVRDGEVVEKGLWPHILYGTIDATPLFLCALADTVDWTGDTALLDELWPNAEAALAWCDAYGDRDADGYIEYGIGIEARNEGWKDSGDSLTNVDGTDVSRPAALCEVQGYLYRALMGMARRRPELEGRAFELRRRFDRDFWMPRERFIAQALDGGKRRVEAVASNPGHCLWSGILSPPSARAVAARLVAPDLFSGWGIRTLSTRAINYDPRSYHNGSVWPHDNAIAAAGLRASGFRGKAERVARATLEAGMAYADRRLPELFSGATRTPGKAPEDYEASCRPQNWGAASAFSMVSTLLGLQADASRGRLRIAPVETALWKRLEVTGLHFAGQRLDFSVEGSRVKLGRVPPGIEVEIAAS